MNGPRRFKEKDDLAGRALATLRHERPSRRARERTAAALGLSVSTAGITVGGSAIGVTLAGGKVGASAKFVGTAAWIKIVLGVAVAVTSGVAVVAIERSSTSSTTSPVHVVATSTSVALETHSPPYTNDVPQPEAVGPRSRSAEVAVTPNLARAPTSTAPLAASNSAGGRSPMGRTQPTATSSSGPAAGGTGPSAPAIESTLTRELRSLDAARAELDHGNAAGALAALDRHESTFPNGALQTEAGVLRVEALLAHGDTARARALARELLARDPSQPHARRLRSVAREDASNP